MKKILLIILSITLLCAAWPVSAKTLLLTDAQPGESVFMVVYDDTDRMVSVEMVTVEPDGKISATIPDMHTVRVYIPKTNTVVAPKIDPKPQPTQSPAPTNTPIPTSTPTPTPETTLHPAYESQAAALYAFMVVKDVTTALQEDMQVVVVEAYHQGRETKIVVEEDAVIDSAPDANSDLIGMPVTDLQEGDVIYCRASLSGQLIGIDLLFRPMTEDIVTTDVAFDTLYTIGGQVAGRWPMLQFGAKPASKNQYAFGVVQDKIGRNTIALTDQAGRALDALYLDMLQDTVVYVYDQAARDPLSIGMVADIFPSMIPADTKDQDENIIQWNDEDEHNYAFVRLYNGIATDIVLYCNY